MITGKQRAKLRAMANTVQPIFQIGKGGISEMLIEQLDAALKARELIKLTVLETAGMSAREASDALIGPLRAEPVQAIGRKVVLFRRNLDAPKIEL